ncbi:MAG: aldo/keto reductase [Aerococcus sp.]|nr:aldo/keto reductase [Aerococcus sp.]
MTMILFFQLNDGNRIPALGFGTFRIPADRSIYSAVSNALKLRYRHIDTAVAYFNEQEVGEAIKDSGIPCQDIWVTSKLWLQDYAYEAAQQAIDTSLEKLGLDYVDRYLMHQPYGTLNEAWQAMREAQPAGKINPLGVSNFWPDQLKTLELMIHVKPAVN